MGRDSHFTDHKACYKISFDIDLHVKQSVKSDYKVSSTSVHKILGVEENTLSGPTVCLSSILSSVLLVCFSYLRLFIPKFNASKELANQRSNLSVFRCPLPRKSFLHTLIIDGF